MTEAAGAVNEEDLHDHVSYELRGRVHRVLEEVYDNRVEALTQSRESPERLLK